MVVVTRDILWNGLLCPSCQPVSSFYECLEVALHNRQIASCAQGKYQCSTYKVEPAAYERLARRHDVLVVWREWSQL